MENNIIIFNNQEFGNVRTIIIDDNPYFCASDVAKALGYKRPNDAISMHCRATVKYSTPISGKNQDINFIPEGDVYRLIIKSKLPSAEKFESWVMDDVLPTLRKTGTYSIYAKPDSYTIEDPAARARRWAEEYEEKQLIMQENEKLVERNDELQSENDNMRPKAKFYDQVGDFNGLISVSKMAALLVNDEFKVGQKALFDYLRYKKMLCTADHVYNKPSSEMLDKGYMKYKTYVHNGHMKNVKADIRYTPQITGSGQRYIYSCVMKDKEYFINRMKKK